MILDLPLRVEKASPAEELARVSETEEGRNGRERWGNTYHSLPQRPSSVSPAASHLPRRGRLGKKLRLRRSWLASARLRRGVMSGSGGEIRTTHSRNAPHPPLRRSPFPGGEGWGKSFPCGRCVAQRIESNIAAGWQLYHKKWCWLASARLRRGVMGESGWKIRTTHSRNAPHPPLRRSPFPGGEG